MLQQILTRAASVVTTELTTPRTVEAATLPAEARAWTEADVKAIPSITEGQAEARRRAGADGMVVATGSVRLAGAVRSLTPNA